MRKRKKFCFTITKTVFGQDEAWTNIELHVWPMPAQVMIGKTAHPFPRWYEQTVPHPIRDQHGYVYWPALQISKCQSPRSVTRAQVFPSRDENGFFGLAMLAPPPYLGKRKREKFCFTITKTVFGQDEAWTNVEMHVWPMPAQVMNGKTTPHSYAVGLGLGYRRDVEKMHQSYSPMTKAKFGQDEAWTNVELHVWPVPAQVKNSKISPSFPPNLPQIHQKDPNLSKKFDENGSNWWKWGRFGGNSLLGQGWGCLGARAPDSPPPSHAQPQQGAPPIYAWCAKTSFVEKRVKFPCRHKVLKMGPRGWIFSRFFAGMLGT